ncbi:hypothetical protein [Streptomyces sp. NPDC054865]
MMIMMRSVVAAAALSLLLPAAAARAAERPTVVPQVLPMGVAVSALALAVEDRTGYQRTSFKQWNSGVLPADGCNTRQEVLLAEAIESRAAPGSLRGCAGRRGELGARTGPGSCAAR